MISDSDGPHSMFVATPWTWARTWAAVTAGPPGPTILATRGTDFVPSTTAATPAGPFARRTRVIPSSRAVASTPGSTRSVPGRGGTTTVISGTPATSAGTPIITRTEGNEPLPHGTKRPALGIARDRSPTTTPGRISRRQSGLAASCASLNARTEAIATRIASSRSGSRVSWAASMAAWEMNSASGEIATLSNRRVASATASSPRAATSA